MIRPHSTAAQTTEVTNDLPLTHTCEKYPPSRTVSVWLCADITRNPTVWRARACGLASLDTGEVAEKAFCKVFTGKNLREVVNEAQEQCAGMY